MKVRIEQLVGALRRAEIAVSIAEAIDAAQAVAMVGIDRRALREALAATLVKDERDRGVFLAAFDATFPARVRDVTSERRRPRARGARAAAGEGGGSGTGDGGEASAGSRATAGASAARTARVSSDEPPPRGKRASSESTAASDPRDVGRDPSAREPTGKGANDARDARGGDPGDAADERDGADAQRVEDGRASDDSGGAADASGALARYARERTLLRLPFRAMTAADVAECGELARAIAARVTARVRRRLAPRPSGRLDFRRTIRAAVPRGGIPFERRYRGRRPGRPDLVALCDLSASTATATDFFLALLAPSAVYFRHVTLFGFVDRLVEIEFVAGQVRPAAPLDLMARSDFGRVLRDLMEDHATILGGDTVLLVLGDARNNRRPPRADLLGAARARVRRALWLNPDPRERWNGGDSVIASYARHVDAVVACSTLAELERALAEVARL